MSAAFPKPVFVFIHGAWHGASMWNSVRAGLEAVGYETWAQTNVSVGLREPAVTSHLEDAAPIREKIREIAAEGKRDVILVGHSYGGMVVGASADGLEREPGRREHGVVGCVYVSSYMMPAGDTVSSFHARWKRLPGIKDTGIIGASLELNSEEKPTHFKVNGVHALLFSDVPKAEADEWVNELDWQTMAVMYSKAASEPWRRIPCMQIYCTEDKALPIQLQRYIVEQASKASKYPIETREIASSHSPWLRHTPELVRYLREAAGERLPAAHL